MLTTDFYLYFLFSIIILLCCIYLYLCMEVHDIEKHAIARERATALLWAYLHSIIMITMVFLCTGLICFLSLSNMSSLPNTGGKDALQLDDRVARIYVSTAIATL